MRVLPKVEGTVLNQKMANLPKDHLTHGTLHSSSLESMSVVVKALLSDME